MGTIASIKFSVAKRNSCHTQNFTTEKSPNFVGFLSPQWCITISELDKKMSELKQEQHGLRQQPAKHQEGDDDFYVSLNLLLELIQNAVSLFQKAEIEQKRKLINLLCWNLNMKDRKLEFSMHSPFDLFLNVNNSQEWLSCQTKSKSSQS